MKVIVYILLNIWNFLVTRFTQGEGYPCRNMQKVRSHPVFPFSNHCFKTDGLYAVETFAVNGISWLSWLTVGAG